MFVRSVLEVLWARRVIVLTALGFALLGGLIVSNYPPRYQATAKVILDYIKPDPITGEFIPDKMAEAYIKTQMRTIRDFQVAVPAADSLGLLDNVDLQTAYATIPDADPADFPRWVARRIISSTGVRMVPESNIIEIAFTSATPEAAQQYVDALRDAYIAASIKAKRESAAGSAESLTVQAASEARALAKLEAAKRELEDVHGVMPALEAQRLADLVTGVRPLYVEQAPSLPSAGKLTAVEVQLAEAAKALGPNHPRYRALKMDRDVLASQVQQERVAAAAAGTGASVAERARQSAIDVQIGRVLSQRQLALELRLIDEEIERRGEVYNGLNTRIANLRELTTLNALNLVPFGEVEVNPSPVFPNPLLILGGGAVLGLGVGGMLAILIEFLNRRIRRPQHLVSAVGVPLLGVMPKVIGLQSNPSKAKKPGFWRRFGRKSVSAA